MASMCALGFDYLNETMTGTWSFAEWNSTDSSPEDAIREEDGRKVAKRGFKLILLDMRHSCSAVEQLKAEDGRKRTKSLLHTSKVNRWDGRAIGQFKSIR